MRKFTVILSVILIIAFNLQAEENDFFSFKGQASAWFNINPGNTLPLWAGLRYIPQGNLTIYNGDSHLLDMEASANLNGSSNFRLFDSLTTDANIKPYRLWLRFSTTRLELRLGLQKINFGSSQMLRPLMWFDQMDPRDPLQLTDGVWALLGRYYFQNNANLWLWSLYGNKGSKTWETGNTNHRIPEWGGRFQNPMPRGEAALSFHHRNANSQNMGWFIPSHDHIPENRWGIDAKWDIEIGLWAEASWINKTKNTGILTNQHIMNLGADYTFGVGNGLTAIAEHLLFSSDEKAFAFENKTHFSALSMAYPLNIFDNVSAMVYYHWEEKQTYNFINWQRQYNQLSFHIMAFWNPSTFQLPQQQETAQMFAGKGFQFMLVYNH